MDMVKFWERKYQRNLGRIVAICYRYVNDRVVAEDLAQDVFVKAMEKFTTLEPVVGLTRISGSLPKLPIN
jgi:DNA-directed RNA polymerase specialized sigma24 family protein